MKTKNIQDVVAERLGYLKDFPVSPYPDCTVSVYEEVIDVFTQLVKEVEAGERSRIGSVLAKGLDEIDFYTDGGNPGFNEVWQKVEIALALTEAQNIK